MKKVREQPQLLTEDEAAKFLRVANQTLRRWRMDNHPPNFIKIGRAVRYDRRDLELFLNKNRRLTDEDHE